MINFQHQIDTKEVLTIEILELFSKILYYNIRYTLMACLHVCNANAISGSFHFEQADKILTFIG